MPELELSVLLMATAEVRVGVSAGSVPRMWVSSNCLSSKRRLSHCVAVTMALPSDAVRRSGRLALGVKPSAALIRQRQRHGRNAAVVIL